MLQKVLQLVINFQNLLWSRGRSALRPWSAVRGSLGRVWWGGSWSWRGSRRAEVSSRERKKVLDRFLLPFLLITRTFVSVRVGSASSSQVPNEGLLQWNYCYWLPLRVSVHTSSPQVSWFSWFSGCHSQVLYFTQFKGLLWNSSIVCR